MHAFRFLSGVLAIMAAVYISPAKADDPAPASHNAFFGYIDGMYVFGNQGSGISAGFVGDGRSTRPGDGHGIAALIGTMITPYWDVALAGTYTSLGKGKDNGLADPDSYGVDKAMGFSVDLQVGHHVTLPNLGMTRVYTGIRYLEWDQEHGFRPPVPAGCCFMNSDAYGIGPLAGFSGSTPGNGTDARTLLNAQGRAGFALGLAEGINLHAGYKINWIGNATYTSQGFSDPSGASGKGDVFNHGPFGGITINLN